MEKRTNEVAQIVATIGHGYTCIDYWTVQVNNWKNMLNEVLIENKDVEKERKEQLENMISFGVRVREYWIAMVKTWEEQYFSIKQPDIGKESAGRSKVPQRKSNGQRGGSAKAKESLKNE